MFIQRKLNWLAAGIFLVVAACAQAQLPGTESDTGNAPSRTAGTGGRKKPVNVLWIVLDALRAENLSCYGYARKTTPAIDRLAAEGLLCERNVTQGFNTVDSVPSYLTGRYFATPCIGRLPWEWAARTPPAGEELAPRTFAKAGYQTWMVTSHLWMTPDTELWRAFESPVFVKAATPQEVQAPFEALSVAAMKLVDQRDVARPFFLYVHALDTHFPHARREKYAEWLPAGVTEAVAPYDAKEQEYLRGVYDGDLAYADNQIENLLRELQMRGLRESTLLVISSDHGEILGEDGETADHRRVVAREMMLTPLVISGPGVPKGRRMAGLTENVDIVPTLLSATGVAGTGAYDGKNLLASEEPQRRYTFTWKRSMAGKKSFVFWSGTWAHDADTGQYWGELAPVARLADNRDYTPSAEVVTEAQGFAEEMQVKFKVFASLPTTRPAVFYMPVPAVATPPEAWVPFAQRSETDNKWDLQEGLARTWPGESAPPLRLEIAVPKGKYDVAMEINSHPLATGGPHCVIAYRVEDAKEWSVVVSPSLAKSAGYAYVGLGRCTVKDGAFSITLRQALPGVAAASVQMFKFTPEALAQSGTVSTQEQHEIDERPRALGYLN